MKELLKRLYLIYWNEFITVEAFADYINAEGLYSKYNYVSDEKALRIIRLGRRIYNKTDQ